VAEEAFGRAHVEKQIHQRQQRSLSRAAGRTTEPTALHPTEVPAAEPTALPGTEAPAAELHALPQSGVASRPAPNPPAAQIRYALVSMGFHPRDAQRALDAILPDDDRSLVELLRQALALLTPRTP
jgi:hypothetical protein